VWRATTYFPPIFLGIVTYVLWRRGLDKGTYQEVLDLGRPVRPLSPHDRPVRWITTSQPERTLVSPLGGRPPGQLFRDRAALLIIWAGLLALFHGIIEIAFVFELKSAQTPLAAAILPPP
jgi:hypothetical protein